MIHYFVNKKKVQFKYAHKLRDIIMSHSKVIIKLIMYQ